MSVVVDAHQHFWTYGTYQTSWMEAPPYAGDPVFLPLRRSFQPADLKPELNAASIKHTIAVEAADGRRKTRRCSPARAPMIGSRASSAGYRRTCRTRRNECSMRLLTSGPSSAFDTW
jgi:hypothetical protein